MPQTNPISWISIILLLIITILLLNTLNQATNFTPVNHPQNLTNPNNINW